MNASLDSLSIQGASTLRRFIQRVPPPPEPEQCDLCAEPIPSEHRHLLEVETREIRCVCRACTLLFDNAAASAGKSRLIPNRCLYLENFDISDAQWESLRIPVGMAFFFHNTPAERVSAFYPGPAGATESLLTLETWTELEERNPLLRDLTPDVEALLVNRARGARKYFIAPVDECYRLVALIRTRWRGLSGGQEVWQEIEQFFIDLQERSKTVD
jgi:hypothetical protein